MVETAELNPVRWEFESPHGHQLLTLYPAYTKVFGPYSRPDGRKHVILWAPGGVCLTISWPKAILEMKLRRRLVDGETADHINEVSTDNSPGNLQPLSRVANIQKHCLAKRPTPKGLFVCPVCSSSFERLMSSVRREKKKGCAGPFCSMKCVWEYLRA